MITEIALIAAMAGGAPAGGGGHDADWDRPSVSYREAARHVNDDGHLNTYIRKAMRVMDHHGIPGSFHDIKRNIMRESSGDPNALNGWDSNADTGTPSKGILQTIPTTFRAYHVEGTSKNIYNPVANIAAACNYAADRYGSIDNVYSAY